MGTHGEWSCVWDLGSFGSSTKKITHNGSPSTSNEFPLGSFG